MALLLLLLLIVGIVTGALWSVLKIAAGVALGIFFAGLLLAFLLWLGIRRAVREWSEGPRRHDRHTF